MWVRISKRIPNVIFTHVIQLVNNDNIGGGKPPKT